MLACSACTTRMQTLQSIMACRCDRLAVGAGAFADGFVNLFGDVLDVKGRHRLPLWPVKDNRGLRFLTSSRPPLYPKSCSLRYLRPLACFRGTGLATLARRCRNVPGHP